MNKLSNFGEFALTRAEMKKVSGGCALWTIDFYGQRVESKNSYTMAQAKQKASQFAQQYNKQFGWCCSSCKGSSV